MDSENKEKEHMIEVAKSVRNIALYSDLSPLKKSNSPSKRGKLDILES
jgi:hypothetical protein